MTFRSMSLPVLSLAVVALLGACSAGTLNYRYVESEYDTQEYASIPYTKAMKLEINGNPFNMPQADFNKLVNDAVQAPGMVPTDASPYRVRLSFNRGATATYLCESTGDPVDKGLASGGMNGGEVTLAAALCNGKDVRTYTLGSIDDVNGPDDPAFKSFLRRAVVYLFPSTPMHPKGDHGCKNRCG